MAEPHWQAGPETRHVDPFEAPAPGRDGWPVLPHHGLFVHPGVELSAALRRPLDLLRRQLPAAPCQLLQWGLRSLDGMLLWQQSGHLVRGSTAWPVLSRAAVARGLGPLVDLASNQAMPQTGPPCQVMLLHDALTVSMPLAVFEAADRQCVPAQAQMVVMDLFALDRSEAACASAPLLEEFIGLARRFGWRLAHQHDLGAEALPSYRALERGLAHAGTGEAPRRQAIDAARQRGRLLADGALTYRLLRLERASAPPLRLARVQAADAVAMRRLFEHVFGHAMSEAEWQWKYGDGQGAAVGLYRGAEMLAHYGGLTRPLLLMGRPGLGCQVGDVMVAPAANAGLGRRLPLHEVAATLLEAEIGWGRRHVVGFGFPNARHMRVAERLGLYAAVDGITQLSWAASPGLQAALAGVEEIDTAALQPGSAAWQALEGLWADMATSMAASALGVRDPAWLHYRYGRRPGVAYALLLLREPVSARPQGAVVVRAHADILEVMDLIAPPTQFPGLVRAARAHAARHRLPGVQAWVTTSHAALLQDPADPPHAEVLDVTVPANVHTPGLAPAALQGRWFLLAGDTDFR